MKYRVIEVTPDKDGEFFLQEGQQLVHVLNYAPSNSYKSCGEWYDVEPCLTLLVTEGQ